MNIYQRTKASSQLIMTGDIYQRNCNHYDDYNWSNQAVWFIYDDMMWWVVSMACKYNCCIGKLAKQAIYTTKINQYFIAKGLDN